MFASDCPYPHPMNMKDIIPTPSDLLNNWNRLFADTRIIIVNEKVVRHLKNQKILGSEGIYHMENFRINQVPKTAIV